MMATSLEMGQSAPLADLEDFFENAAVGLHIVAGDGTILRANKAELEMLGYSIEEYVGRHISDFHADEMTIGDILTRLGRGERLEKYPATLRAKDGSVRHVLITSSALFREGKFVQTRCFTFDVTQARAAEERLREGEQLFQTMIEALPAAIYTTNAQGVITFFNQAAAELAGRKPEVGLDKWCVTWRLFRPDGAQLPLDQCPMAIALKEGRPVRGEELIAERPDGSRARLVPYPTPLYDSEGRLTGGINMLVDITERHASEENNARLAAIVRSSEDAIISTTMDGLITYWSDGAAKVYGYEPQEMIGQSIMRIIPPDLHDEELEVQHRLHRGERIEYYETERLNKDGKRVSISLSVTGVRDKVGNAIGIARVGRDITERKAAERVQKLLMGELNHRVKNTLATVQAIANQSVHAAKSPTEFANSFGGRLQALARAHSLLTNNSWQGTDLAVLICDQLLLGDVDDSRVICSGPTVALDPQAALHLALVLHELGTNARKYGSLSVPEGRLSISWTIRANGGRNLHFQWKEHGGPAVTAPSRRGFGTTLIERSLQAHGGEVVVEFRSSGLTCEIKFPIRESANSSAGTYRSSFAAPSSAKNEGVEDSGIRNKRLLVVDDEPLVVMDVVAMLEQQGCEIVGPAATLANARTLIESSTFDAALLDANLGGQSVEELAAALTRLNIPFAFLTGYGREGLPEAFRQAPLIAKPYNERLLLAAVAQLFNRHSSAVPLRQKVR